MNKAIVTTTINYPTEALHKFLDIAERDEWTLIIVGDKKTPHEAYEELEKDHKDFMVYLHPDIQHARHRNLSELIGWNCIQRRNFGFIFALEMGAEIIATIDDDNIPLDNWGKEILLGKEFIGPTLCTDQEVCDPLAMCYFWHRGFPIQLLEKRKEAKMKGLTNLIPLVQAGLWLGSPDVDAIGRICFDPELIATPLEDNVSAYSCNKIAPFNSQNTILHKDIFPEYFLFPHIGRMDDIWASYYVQHKYPRCVVYTDPTVRQDRNEHNLFKDLEAEMLGYEFSLNVATDITALDRILPTRAKEAFTLYREIIDNLK